jgi:hypothetical protein
MKTSILLSIFFIGMVLGTMMMVFGNHLGDYIVIASVFLGLYTMERLEKEEKKDPKSFFSK